MSRQAELFRGWLAPSGVELSYVGDRSAFAPERLAGADLLLLMGADWSVKDKLKPDAWEDPSEAGPYSPMTEAQWAALQGYLAQGKPLYVHHTGLLSFDERKELETIYDGRWIVGQSSHPPAHSFEVEVADKAHPVTEDLSSFTTFDELYIDLNGPKHSRVLLRARYQGVDRPLAWAGEYGRSKVICQALGHDLRSYENPMVRKFFVNAVRWLTEN
jgi:hypothetical protein